MALYQDMQDVASGLLKEFKQGSVIYVRINPGVGPAHNPGPSSETLIPLNGAVAKGATYKYLALGLASHGDKQVTMSAQLVPALADFVIVDGIRYKLKSIEGRPGAGIPSVYVLIAGKG